MTTEQLRLEFNHNIGVLCESFNGSVTSWWRSKAHNEKVGGLPTSKHLIGLAVDIVLDNPMDKGEFFKLVRKLGLVYLDEGSHVHVQVPKESSNG